MEMQMQQYLIFQLYSRQRVESDNDMKDIDSFQLITFKEFIFV